MSVIKEFTNVVYVGRGGGVRNPEPATIYIDKPGKTARWPCPCGCGHQMEVKYRLCKQHELPRDIDKDVVNMSINVEGEVTFHCGFVHPDCPNGLAYGIEDNEVKVWLTNSEELNESLKAQNNGRHKAES